MITIRNTSTPVVILKSVGHGGLGILRSLGRLGIAVHVVDSDPRTAAFFSRYCRRKFICDIDETSGSELVPRLLEAGRKIGRKSILIPTTDYAVTWLADHGEALKEWFIFPSQRPELVHALCSKKHAYYLAKKFGIPTAETNFPQSRADVQSFIDKGAFPVMLKGIDGRLLWKRAGKRMYIVDNAKDLLEKYDAMENQRAPNLMLQEYIPGGEDSVWMFNGHFNDRSECLIAFTGQKIRQCPVYTGSTSLGMCLNNETVGRLTKEFMKAIGYKGILDIGYRYDARDGLYKVLDINPRIGATFRLFVAENGMDVVRALYLDLTGQPMVPGAAPEGRKWFVEDLDVASCIQYGRDGNLTFMQWITSFRGVKEAAYFALDDLLPVLAMILNGVRELSRRAYAKLRTKKSGKLLRPSPDGAGLERNLLT